MIIVYPIEWIIDRYSQTTFFKTGLKLDKRSGLHRRVLHVFEVAKHRKLWENLTPPGYVCPPSSLTLTGA